MLRLINLLKFKTLHFIEIFSYRFFSPVNLFLEARFDPIGMNPVETNVL